jgi:hypothetical protein
VGEVSGGVFKRPRVLQDEESQLEEEYTRISLIQAYAPWAETRFAEYLSIDPMPDTENEPELVHENADLSSKTRPLDWQQHAKQLRQTANRLWNDTIAAAQRSRAKDDSIPEEPKVAAMDLRRQQDEEDAGRWALHRRLKAVSEILQVDHRIAGTEEQLRLLVTSEVRIKRLRNKLDEGGRSLDPNHHV